MTYHAPKNIITSKRDLFNIIQTVRDYSLQVMCATGQLVREMFRGQGQNKDSWTLRPNIVRKLTDPSQAKEIEKKLIKEFNAELSNRKLSKSLQEGFLHSKYHTDWLLLQQSQHYRIPTRFMDWTKDWEVALFFAVSNTLDDDYDGQFWIYVIPPNNLTTDVSNSQYLNFDPFEFKQTIFLNSSGYLSDGYLDKTAQRRKSVQNGRFCIQPYERIFIPLEQQGEHKPNLTKIIIPKELKIIIRNELTELNYTNESLFVKEEDNINEIVMQLRDKYKV